MFWIFFISIQLLFSEGLIKGRVVDGTNQLPLSDANVTIVGTENGNSTNHKGEFLIGLDRNGYYSIKVSFIGYESVIISDIWVRPNANDFQNIQLYPSIIEYRNIVVSENYFQRNSLNNQSSIKFKNDQIRRAPGAGNELTRILNSLPSVASVGENRQDIMVRGGGPNENGFIIDNIFIPSISHFNQPDGRSNGPVGLINTELVENLEFYSNGFSPEYGNKLSSYGDISYRNGNNERFEGNVGLGLGGAGAVLEGPLGKHITLIGSFRMSYLDIIANALNAGGLPSYSDYQGKINYTPSQFNNFTFLVINGNSLYDRAKSDAVQSGEGSYGTVSNDQYTIGMNHRHIWSKNTFSNNSVSISSQKSNIGFFGVSNDSLLNGINDNYRTSHFRNVNHTKLFKNLSAITGFEIHKRNLDYDFTLNDISLKDDVSYENISTFLSLSTQLYKKASLSIGARIENSSYEKSFNISPRTVLNIDIPKEFGNIIISTGKYYQNPPEKYLGLVADSKLRSVYALQNSITFEKLITPSTKFSLSIYNKEYGNAPMLSESLNAFTDPAFLMDRNITYSNIVSEGVASASGIEVLIEKKRAKNFYGLIGGSVYNSIFIDYNGVERNRDNNYQYIFNVLGGYRPSNKWELSLRWSVFGGRPYTKVDELSSIYYNEPLYLVDEFNMQRTPVYHNLFLRYEYRRVYSFGNLIGYIEFWNAYNRNNVETYFWSTARQEVLETNYFSFIPVGGFEIEF